MKASESLEGKKPSARFELLEGVGSEFRSKEELISGHPHFMGNGRVRQKSSFSAAHNGALLKHTKPSSFLLQESPGLPNVRLRLFCYPPEGSLLLIFPEFSLWAPARLCSHCELLSELRSSPGGSELPLLVLAGQSCVLDKPIISKAHH